MKRLIEVNKDLLHAKGLVSILHIIIVVAAKRDFGGTKYTMEPI